MTNYQPHPLPVHPHGIGPEWIVNVREDVMARESLAGLLTEIASAIAAGPDVEIGGTVISVPAELAFELRYERTPRGALALVIRGEWSPNAGRTDTSLSATGLVIRPVKVEGAGLR